MAKENGVYGTLVMSGIIGGVFALITGAANFLSLVTVAVALWYLLCFNNRLNR